MKNNGSIGEASRCGGLPIFPPPPARHPRTLKVDGCWHNASARRTAKDLNRGRVHHRERRIRPRLLISDDARPVNAVERLTCDTGDERKQGEEG